MYDSQTSTTGARRRIVRQVFFVLHGLRFIDVDRCSSRSGKPNAGPTRTGVVSIDETDAGSFERRLYSVKCADAGIRVATLNVLNAHLRQPRGSGKLGLLPAKKGPGGPNLCVCNHALRYIVAAVKAMKIDSRVIFLLDGFNDNR